MSFECLRMYSNGSTHPNVYVGISRLMTGCVIWFVYWISGESVWSGLLDFLLLLLPLCRWGVCTQGSDWSCCIVLSLRVSIHQTHVLSIHRSRPRSLGIFIPSISLSSFASLFFPFILLKFSKTLSKSTDSTNKSLDVLSVSPSVMSEISLSHFVCSFLFFFFLFVS